MLAANARLGVAAHNIANSQTQDFNRQQVVQATSVQGGVTVTLQSTSNSGTEPLGTLEDDLIQQMQAAYEFKANLNVVKVQYEMLGQLLDLKA